MGAPEGLEEKYRAKYPHGIAAAYGQYSLPKELAGMDDETLGKWHAEHVKDNPQSAECILAAQEWQRRLTMRQVEATIKAATEQVEGVIRTAKWMVIATICAAIIAVLLTPFAQDWHDQWRKIHPAEIPQPAPQYQEPVLRQMP